MNEKITIRLKKIIWKVFFFHKLLFVTFYVHPFMVTVKNRPNNFVLLWKSNQQVLLRDLKY